MILALTNCIFVKFLKVMRVGGTFQYYKSESLSVDGIGGRMLRTLAESALTPDLQLSFPLMQHGGADIIAGKCIHANRNSTVCRVTEIKNCVLKICHARTIAGAEDMAKREDDALRRIHAHIAEEMIEGLVGCVIECLVRSRNALLLRPRATRTVADEFLGPVEDRRQVSRTFLSCVPKLLKTCHDAGVFHCDCRATNLLLFRRKVILADFGCSMMANAAGPMTMGAPEIYCSASVLAGNPFRPADDLHIFARAVYFLHKSHPQVTGPEQMNTYWGTVARKHYDKYI